jgi:choline dehydrogenase
VLLIEAGGKDDYHWIHIPVGYLYCIGNPRTDWLYNTEPAAGLNGRTLRYPRGKVLGGCSSINGMIYMRGQARDYDQWAQLTGDETWRWDCLFKLPITSSATRTTGALRGWQTPTPSAVWRRHPAANGASRSSACAGTCSTPLRRPRRQAGIPATDDFNRGDNEGVGYFEVNQRAAGAGTRPRPSCARPATRAQPSVWTSAQVARLVFEPAGPRTPALHRRAGLERPRAGPRRPPRAR